MFTVLCEVTFLADCSYFRRAVYAFENEARHHSLPHQFPCLPFFFSYLYELDSHCFLLALLDKKTFEIYRYLGK